MQKKTKVEFEFVPLDERLKASLRETQKVAEDTEKAANKSVVSIGQIASAIVGAGALQKIKGFFNEAFEASNRLEASMMRVNALARVTGQDAAKAQAAVVAESKRGILSLTENAQAFADAMSLGLSVDQAREFITALEDIASVQRTMGTTAEAVTSGIAGLVSGSTERVENIGNSVKKLNMQFTANKNTMGEAAAIQQLYNGVIKEGAKFQGDAARQADTAAGAQKRYNAAIDEAKAAIGEGLKPAYKALYEALIPVIEAFTNWFSGLGESTKLVVSLGTAVAMMVPAIAAIIPLLGALSLAMGPVTMIAAAVAGVTGLLAMAMESARKANTTPLANEYNSLVAKQQENARLLTEKEKERLSYLEKLIDKNGGVLARMQMQNQTLQQQEQYLRQINALEEQRTKMSSEVREKLKKATREDLENIRKMYKEEERTAPKRTAGEMLAGRASGLERGELGLAREDTYYYGDLAISEKASEARIAEIESANRAAVKERRSLEALNRLGISPELLKKSGADILKEIETIIGEASKVAKNPAKYFGLALREELREIAQGYYSFVSQTQGQIRKLEAEAKTSVTAARRAQLTEAAAGLRQQIEEANRVRKQQEQQAISQRRQQLAEYIEDQVTAEKIRNAQDFTNARIALEERKKFDVEYAKEAAREKLTVEEKFQKDVARLSGARRAKDLKADLDAYSRTLSGADQITKGIANIGSAQDLGAALRGFGGIGSGLGAMKDLFPALSFMGPVGAGLGAAGSLIGTLSSLFGKSDEERAREAEAQKRRDEEAKALLQLQANYQKNMLALQEAQAKLPFENLTRNLRLIDIKAQQQRVAGVDEASIERERLASRQGAIQTVLQAEAGTIGQGALFSGVQATPEGLTQFLKERAGQSAAVGQAMALANQIQNLPGMSSAGARGYIQEILRQLDGLQGQIPPELYSAIRGPLDRAIQSFNTLEAQTYDLNKMTVSSVDTGIFLGDANRLASEIARDTTTAENLLSVIEQSNQVQLEIAANTKRTADNTQKLEGMREQMFLDIAGGGLRGFGNLLRGNYGLNTASLTVPQGIQSAILATQMAKSFEESSLDKLIELLSVNKDMAKFLGEIAVNTGRMANGGANITGTPTEFDNLATLEKYASRS